MLTRRSEPGPSQSMEAQSGLGVKNDAMVFDVVDPSVVVVGGGDDDAHNSIDDDGVDGVGHVNSGCFVNARPSKD